MMTVCCFPLEMERNAFLDTLYTPMRRRQVLLVPYDWLLSNWRPHDIFHIHWPDAVVMGKSSVRAALKLFLFMISVLASKLRGAKIVYSVHNLRSHDNLHPVLEGLLWRFLLPRVDAFVHLNQSSMGAFGAVRGRQLVIPHPRYDVAVPDAAARSRARADLGFSSDDFVFLNVGLLRPYKGVEDLISAFAGFPNARAGLVIAGEALDADYRQKIADLAKPDRRLRLMLRFLDDAELARVLGACDAVVLAHRKINNSGVAILALSAGKPVIGPRMGALIDLERQVGAQWVTLFDGPIGPDSFDAAMRRARLDAPPDLGALDPERIAASLLDLFTDLSGRPWRTGAEEKAA